MGPKRDKAAAAAQPKPRQPRPDASPNPAAALLKSLEKVTTYVKHNGKCSSICRCKVLHSHPGLEAALQQLAALQGPTDLSLLLRCIEQLGSLAAVLLEGGHRSEAHHTAAELFERYSPGFSTGGTLCSWVWVGTVCV